MRFGEAGIPAIKLCRMTSSKTQAFMTMVRYPLPVPLLQVETNAPDLFPIYVKNVIGCCTLWRNWTRKPWC